MARMKPRWAGSRGVTATRNAREEIDAAHAAIPVNHDPAGNLKAGSYAELLDPTPNPADVLKADDAARAAREQGGVQLAQIIIREGRWHHHHHHWRRPPPRFFFRHHHHHHHHHHFYRRDRF